MQNIALLNQIVNTNLFVISNNKSFQNFKKQYLLLALLDDSISIYEKINLLLEHTYLNDFINSAINITAGGLFDDYDFDNF